MAEEGGQQSKEVLDTSTDVGNERGRTAALRVRLTDICRKSHSSGYCPCMERCGASACPHPHPGDTLWGKQQWMQHDSAHMGTKCKLKIINPDRML